MLTTTSAKICPGKSSHVLNTLESIGDMNAFVSFRHRPRADADPPPRLRPKVRPVKLKDVKIRGYVTEFRSPTDFDIEDYRITRDEAFALDFENASPDVVFQLQDIRVGVELEIKGLLNEQTGELKATAIKVDLEQFKSIKQTAFVSHAPEGIQLLDGSWAGELRADGQIDSSYERHEGPVQADEA